MPFATLVKKIPNLISLKLNFISHSVSERKITLFSLFQHSPFYCTELITAYCN